METNGWTCRNSVAQHTTITPQQETIKVRNAHRAWQTPLHQTDNCASLLSPVFELAPLEQLPAFDTSKTIKTMLLNPGQIRRLSDFKSQWKNVIGAMMQLGNLLMLLTTFVPRQIGSVMAVLAPLLQVIGMFFVLASIRIGMLRLLFSTYDFWYFSVNNLIFGVCFTAMLRDIRVVTVFVACVIVQISIGADALVGDRHQLFHSSVINCGTHFAMFIAVFLKVVDDNGNGDSLILSNSSTGHGFSIRDTLMNTQLNMILLFGRLVYRNWVSLSEQDASKVRQINSETSYIPCRRRCVSYYCTVGLRPKTSTPTSFQESIVRAKSTSSILRISSVDSTNDGRYRSGSVVSIQALDSYRTPSRLQIPLIRGDLIQRKIGVHRVKPTQNQHHAKIQLHFVPISEDFNAYKTLLPGFGRLLHRVLEVSAVSRGRPLLLILFHALGYVGMGVLVLGALVAWVSNDHNLDNLRPGLARTQKMAFFASLLFCGVFFAAYQRQLLRRLYSSFNFIFLSTKLTMASLALCQFFSWDSRVVWVWSAWIWMQWAITLDALPPSAMRLLAFRRSKLMLSVLTFELIGLIILSLELFAFDRWIVPSRTVIDRVIMGRHIQLSTLSALISRLWTILLWDCKLIWFLLASLRRQRHRRVSIVDASATDDDEGERLLLTGRVEFFYEWASRSRSRSVNLRWSRGIQILRASQALLRRHTMSTLRPESNGTATELS
ncbi:unnamed protein product [Phytophthora fragariaefolia]|uniref:Unnamed protein product n=1 Tax=Phytophthora fragariaefolia TaxID=1490495 RepID=A0A9W6YAJ5_9STRA|nr:unnamed protein product [Phytophthora fragariaefolia]